MHKQNVKKEKHKLKQQKKFQKAGVNERIKQAPQKKNAGKKSKIKEKGVQKDDKSFSDLVNKYKSKLVAGQPMKSKWYEQR